MVNEINVLSINVLVRSLVWVIDFVLGLLLSVESGNNIMVKVIFCVGDWTVSCGYSVRQGIELVGVRLLYRRVSSQ